MTIYLDEILDPEELAKEIEAGYVRERFHPADPTYRILNYSEQAQFERRWNDVTKQCRGLIVRENRCGEEIIARPWAKFFNYGEHEPGSLPMDAPVEVLDKMDGSLGIIYQGPEGWAVATRGSFESEQAIRGTAMLRQMMAEDRCFPPIGWTWLTEIIYPGNRIVVDYGDREELVLLGAVNTTSGLVTGPGHWGFSWNGARAEAITAHTLTDALALPSRPNAEGVVVRFEGSRLMVKLKYEEYTRLHKLVTGLSEKAVWEHLSEHDNIDTLISEIPDEFHDWVLKVADDLNAAYCDIYARAWAAYQEVLDRLPGDFERGEYASAVRELPNKGLLFMLLDGKDVGPAIWKMIRPVGHRPMTHRTEDEA